MTAFNKLKDTLAINTFGLTKKEALAQSICISCKESALPRCYSEAGKREYAISGLCEVCFDEICGGPNHDAE